MLLSERQAQTFQIAAQCLNQLRALPYEKITRPMQSQDALLMDILDCDEAHRRSAGRFTDCLSIRAVSLVPLDEWLHVLRRDHPHLMSVFGDLRAQK